MFQDRRGRLWRCEEAEQRERGVRLTGRTGDGSGERKSGLEFGRNRPDKGHTRDVYELADLLKADLHLAARDDRGHRFAGRRSAYLSTLA